LILFHKIPEGFIRGREDKKIVCGLKFVVWSFLAEGGDFVKRILKVAGFWGQGEEYLWSVCCVALLYVLIAMQHVS
jgi:hypothetical protein